MTIAELQDVGAVDLVPLPGYERVHPPVDFCLGSRDLDQVLINLNCSLCRRRRRRGPGTLFVFFPDFVLFVFVFVLVNLFLPDRNRGFELIDEELERVQGHFPVRSGHGDHDAGHADLDQAQTVEDGNVLDIIIGINMSGLDAELLHLLSLIHI